MRYVMVPVPSEYVLEVMRLVLFRSPDEDENAIRDHGRLKKLVVESDELTRSILRLVAEATIEDRTLRLTDVADEVGLDAATARGVLRELDARALGGDRTLVKVLIEPAVGVHGNKGKVSYLTMRPRHARQVRAALQALDAPTA